MCWSCSSSSSSWSSSGRGRRCCRCRCFAARCFVRRIVGELVKSRKGELARAIVTSIALVNAPLTRTSGQTRKIYRLRAGKTTTTRCTTVAGEFSRDFKSSWNYVFSANVGRRGIARISLSLSLPSFFFLLFSFRKEREGKKRSSGWRKLKIRSKTIRTCSIILAHEPVFIREQRTDRAHQQYS